MNPETTAAEIFRILLDAGLSQRRKQVVVAYHMGRDKPCLDVMTDPFDPAFARIAKLVGDDTWEDGLVVMIPPEVAEILDNIISLLPE